MKLPEERRHKFKEPLGKLFRDTKRAFKYLNSIDYEKIVTVGDVVSAKFLQNELEPDMVIVDFTVKRARANRKIEEVIQDYSVPSIGAENPPGHITEELWESIRTAETPVKILVDGEEDLATIPATLHAPNGSIVAYGQPDEGIVLINVTGEKKEEFRGLLKSFESE